MKKADYQSIAPNYDRGRPITAENLRLWLDPVAKHTQSAGGRPRLIDFGCGTGRFALPLAYGYGFEVTAVDSSAAMLDEGRRKDRDGKIRWQQADAEKDEWPEASFDAVFMSHLLHHLDDPARFLSRCVSMLCPGGSIFIRYGALEHVLKDPIHRFFPRTKELDAVRTPSKALVRRWLKVAGFTAVRTFSRNQVTYASAAEMRECVRLKGTSVLTLIGDGELEEGLVRLDAHIARHSGDPWLVRDKISLTSGVRPK